MRATEFLYEAPALQVHQAPGAAIPPAKISQLAELIAAGGEVVGRQVLGNLKNSPSVAWADFNNMAIGVIALKRPVPSYHSTVFAKAGVPELAGKYPLERGYLFVSPEFRSQGIANKLRSMLDDKSVYVTTREQNNIVNQSLQHAGFKQLGRSWPSSRGDYNLMLWVKA